MNFSRKKKRGQVQKHHKTWLSDCGQYKVDWRNEIYGVRIKPNFHATVLCIRNLGENHKQWEFAGRRGPYKTLEAAQQACEHHYKCWLEAIEISEGERTGRADRLRSLEYRSRLKIARKKGKTRTITHQRIMGGVPIWVTKRANKVLLEHFFMPPRKRAVEDEDECESAPTTASSNSASDSLTPTESKLASDTPAPPARDVEKSSTPAPSASTKRERNTSRAKSAEAAEKAPSESASKRTARSSKSGGRKSGKTKSKRRSAKAA